MPRTARELLCLLAAIGQAQRAMQVLMSDIRAGAVDPVQAALRAQRIALELQHAGLCTAGELAGR